MKSIGHKGEMRYVNPGFWGSKFLLATLKQNPLNLLHHNAGTYHNL
jgi:hypothetical protein